MLSIKQQHLSLGGLKFIKYMTGVLGNDIQQLSLIRLVSHLNLVV